MATIIDGKGLAKKTREKLKEECNELRSKGITPKLAVIMVGNNPASKVYVKNYMLLKYLVKIHQLFLHLIIVNLMI